jgi:flagellar hook-basal body complex protein FliE
LSHTLTHLSQAQTTAETDVAQAISGQGSITQAMTAVSESQTALDVATSMRNALVQAGTSIMNLQI